LFFNETRFGKAREEKSFYGKKGLSNKKGSRDDRKLRRGERPPPLAKNLQGLQKRENGQHPVEKSRRPGGGKALKKKKGRRRMVFTMALFLGGKKATLTTATEIKEVPWRADVCLEKGLAQKGKICQG